MFPTRQPLSSQHHLMAPGRCPGHEVRPVDPQRDNHCYQNLHSQAMKVTWCIPASLTATGLMLSMSAISGLPAAEACNLWPKHDNVLKIREMLQTTSVIWAREVWREPLRPKHSGQRQSPLSASRQ